MSSEESTKEKSPPRSLVEESGTREDDLLQYDAAEERKIVRKLDFSLIPLMTMFYLLSFLVRIDSNESRVPG